MDDPVTIQPAPTSPITRRRLLQAGAVVGGSLWVAPVVDSFLTPAAAGSLGLPSTAGCPGCAVGVFELGPNQTATIHLISSSASDQEDFGYQLDSGPLTVIASKTDTTGSFSFADFVLSPSDGKAHTLQLYLEDYGIPASNATCDYVFMSNGNHACAVSTGTDTWDIYWLDSDVCNAGTSVSDCPNPAGSSNLAVSLTISS